MEKSFKCTLTEPIVETKQGRLRGFLLDGVNTFLGIKYADAKRFQAPTSVRDWHGIKDAISYGYTCPILYNPEPTDDVLIPHRYWPSDEHCQNLNIWTKHLDRKAKKPVMVWIHGGQFSSGSSLELAAYNGSNMAKYGDVVLISLNHRHNILGHLDMSSFGLKYANSVNAGIADLVKALQWVKENIEGFGGDPGNITIFGQSGGGRKVTTLMQTPAASGLFHKAIIQSGTAEWNPVSSEHHIKLVGYILNGLQIPESEFEKLEIVPYPVLAQSYARAHAKLKETDGVENIWTPVKNDWFLGAPPSFAFSDFARKIPLMAGSVFAEANKNSPMPDKDSYSVEKRREVVATKYGEHADELIALFKKAYPGKNEVMLIDLDCRYRSNLLNYIERKVDENDAEARVYLYFFGLEFDYHGGRSAWHCSEIPFAFHNTEMVPVCNMEGIREKLQAEMNGAWVNFARTGNPNHPGLPEEWTAYDKKDRAVMVFDRESGIRRNHEKELITLLKKLTPPRVPNIRNAQTDDETWVF